MIQIQKDKVSSLVNIFDGNFEYLAEHLKIVDDRMVLVNPNFDKPKSIAADNENL